MLLQKGDQPAFRQYALHCRRQHNYAAIDIARCDADGACGQIDRNAVAVRDTRNVAFDDRQAVVDRVAEELPAE